MAWVLPYLYDVAIAYAVSYAINAFFGPKSSPQIFSPKFSDNQAMVRSAVEAHKVVYGRALVSGPLIFAASSGANNKYMNIVVPLTGHEVESIGTTYFDDISTDGAEYNKIQVFTISGYNAAGSETINVFVVINGYGYTGTGSVDVFAKHKRIKTVQKAMASLLASITGGTGTAWPAAPPYGDVSALSGDVAYASRNYTAEIGPGGMSVLIKGKTITDEPTVVAAYSEARTVSDGEGSFVTLSQRAHIFDLYKHLGTPTQLADDNLIGEGVGWTENHRLRGRAYIYARMEYLADRWPTGIPAIKAEVYGKKVYDPRTTLTAWSDNPALCIRDYLVSAYGLASASTEIDDASFIAAANICDELVLSATPVAISSSSVASETVLEFTAPHYLRAGDSVVIAGHTGSTPSINGTYVVTVIDSTHVSIPVAVTVAGTGGTAQLQQKRYSMNGVVSLGDKPIDVMQRMLTSLDGTLVYTEGKYKLYAGAYTAPVGQLNESHLRGGIQVTPKASRKQLFNGVRGTFVDKTRYWQETDFPPYKNSTYIAQDAGEEIYSSISLPFTTDTFQAQRLSKQLLERARQGITVVFPAKINTFKYAVNDVVQLSIAHLGWTNKEFRIVSWSLADFGVDIVLREESSAAYNWSNGDETHIDTAPDTGLPTPFNVAAPVSVTATEEIYQAVNTAGSKVRINVSWAPADASATNYVVYWRAFPDETQTSAAVADGHSPVTRELSYSIEDVAPGYYYVWVVAVSDLGINSPDSEVLEVIVAGRTIPPATVTGFSASQNGSVVVMRWNQVIDIDLLGYEIRYGSTVATWEGGLVLSTSEASNQVTTATVPPGTWKLMIKAVDKIGNYSVAEASTALTVEAVQDIIFQQEQAPNWLGTISTVVGENAPGDGSALLLEDGSYLLNEDGGFLLLQNPGGNLLLEDGSYLLTENGYKLQMDDPLSVPCETFVRHTVSGRLIPNSTRLAREMTNAELFERFVAYPQPLCMYDAPEIDQAFDDISRVWASMQIAADPSVVTGDLLLEDNSYLLLEDGSKLVLEGWTSGPTEPQFYLDYRLAAGVYDGHEPWTIGDRDARYFSPQLRLDTTNGAVSVTSFLPTVDLQETSQPATAVIAGGGTTVTFARPYHTAPIVAATVVSASALFAVISNVTTTGFTCNVYNTAGTSVGGTINYTASGV